MIVSIEANHVQNNMNTFCVRTQHQHQCSTNCRLAFFEIQPVTRWGYEFVHNVTCLGPDKECVGL